MGSTGGSIDGSEESKIAPREIDEEPPVDGVIVMVPAPGAVEVVHEAADAGIRHVWLFRGAGSPGALTDETVAACRAHDIDVVAGACPLMFLDPVGAVHALHRTVRRADRSLVGDLAPR